MIKRPTIQAGNFDSVLHPAKPGQPATLTIRLKVRLLARDPQVVAAPNRSSLVRAEHFAATEAAAKARSGTVHDANGNPFRCISWTRAEFNSFCIRFKKIVEIAWNNQLILLPPQLDPQYGGFSDEQYRDFISAPAVPAHVRCGLDVQLLQTGSTSTPHAVMEVLQLDPAGQQFRSFAWRISNEDLDASVSPDPDWEGRTYRQFTAAHEVGHWLGRDVPMSNNERFFMHVEWAQCKGTADGTCQYGQHVGTRMSMMGMGTLLTPYDATPWLLRIVTHTGSLYEFDYAHRVHFDRKQVPVSPRQLGLVGGPMPAGAGRVPAPAHP